MAEKVDPKEMTDLRQVILSEVIQREAIVNLLARKGILNRREILEEVKKIAANMPKAKT